MRQALSLGRRGLGRTWPNPSVGCVIVKDGIVQGRGWTAPGGRPHAEVLALGQAGTSAAGATAYVTLEPCAHHGKTPPCAEALRDAGIARVVIAAEDPNPQVSGRGMAMLRAAGITVHEGCLRDQAEADLAGFLRVMTEARPDFTLKLATSLDGRIATATGESRWITGGAARRRVHLMRAQHDAVMVGSGTVAADDPMLDVRDLGLGHQPVRIVCDTHLSSNPAGRLGRSARDIPVWMCHAGADPDRILAWQNTGARLLDIPAAPDGRLALAALAQVLAEQGLTRVMVEGGGTLGAAFLEAGLVDHLIGFTAPLTLGAEGIPGIGALAQRPLADFPRFDLVAVERLGPDVLHHWKRRLPDPV